MSFKKPAKISDWLLSIPAWLELKSFPEGVEEGEMGENLGTGLGRGAGTAIGPGTEHSSLARGVGEKETRGRVVGGGKEITWVIPNLADGGRGWAINASKGGASTEDNKGHHGRKGPPGKIS